MSAAMVASLALLAGEPSVLTARSQDGRFVAQCSSRDGVGDKPCTLALASAEQPLWTREYRLRLEKLLVLSSGQVAGISELTFAAPRANGERGAGCFVALFDQAGALLAEHAFAMNAYPSALFEDPAGAGVVVAAVEAGFDSPHVLHRIALATPQTLRSVAIDAAAVAPADHLEPIDVRGVPGTDLAVLLWRSPSAWQVDVRSSDLEALIHSTRVLESAPTLRIAALHATRVELATGRGVHRVFDIAWSPAGVAVVARPLDVDAAPPKPAPPTELELRELAFVPLAEPVGKDKDAYRSPVAFDLDGRVWLFDRTAGSLSRCDPASGERVRIEGAWPDAHSGFARPNLFAFADGSVCEFDAWNGTGRTLVVAPDLVARAQPLPESGAVASGGSELRWVRSAAEFVDETGAAHWRVWAAPSERPWHRLLGAARLANGDWLLHAWWSRLGSLHHGSAPFERGVLYSERGECLGTTDLAAGRSGLWRVEWLDTGKVLLERRTDGWRIRPTGVRRERIGKVEYPSRVCVAPDGRELWQYSYKRGGVVRFALPEP